MGWMSTLQTGLAFEQLEAAGVFLVKSRRLHISKALCPQTQEFTPRPTSSAVSAEHVERHTSS